MSRPAIRVVAWSIALGLIAAPIVAALNGWFANDRWPIRRLVVHGTFVQVTESDVRTVIAPTMDDGFFAIELDQVRGAVEALPWVARAEVRKQWPDRIDVLVEERVPIAVWGGDRLLGNDGVLFAARWTGADLDLPILDGPDALAADVWREWQRVSVALQQAGLEPRGLRLSDRGAWSATIGNGSEVLLGREFVHERLTRFVSALNRLPESERSRIERADLRFANGFSVRWHEPLPPASPDQPLSSGDGHDTQV